MSCYEIFDNIFSFLNIVVIIVLAKGGFDAWKKQQFLIERHDRARDLLKNVYLLRKKIDYVRSPFMSAGEVSEGAKRLDYVPSDLDQEQKQKLGEINAYYARWEGVSEIGSELETLKIEGKIVFGIDVESLFKDFNQIITDVKMALYFYALNKNALVYGQMAPISEDNLKNYMKVLMQGYSAIDDEEDPIDTRFDNVIKLIEKALRKYIELNENKKTE